jgi:metal-responsive CopG/Arc/MetJ family transcriptional regulator
MQECHASEAADVAKEGTRLTLRLSPEANAALDEICRLRGGVSRAEAIRRAIGTELFLVEASSEKSRILLEDKNKNIREIILR